MTSDSRPKLPALTSLRYFGALHVLVFHMLAIRVLVHSAAAVQQFAYFGFSAVTFFFLLSGFVLVYTYEGRELQFRPFLRARLARLYPVYLLSFMLNAAPFLFVVYKLRIPEYQWFAHHMGATVALQLTALQSWVPQAALSFNAPSWAVSTELAFYFAFPFLLPRMARLSVRKLVVVAGACWALSLAMGTAYWLTSPDGIKAGTQDLTAVWLNVLKFNPISRLPEFVAGMAMGLLFLKAEARRYATTLVIAGLAMIAVVFALGYRIPYPIAHTGFLTPAFAAVILGVALRPSWASLLENRVLVKLGETSYAFYLLHSFAIGPFFFPKPEDSGTPLRIIGATLTAAAVAYVAYRFVESPLNRRLRYGKRREQPRVAAARA